MSANSSGTAFASWPTTCANFGTTAPCSQWVSMKDAATGKITSYSYTILK